MPAFAQKKTLTYWGTFTTARELAGYARVIALFNQKYPDIRIVAESIPSASFMGKITAAVAAQSPPSTSMFFSERRYDMVGMNGLVDLTDRINNWSARSDYSPKTWSEADVGGRYYGVPVFKYVDWMYYRKDWLAEAGLEPPKTLDDLVVVAKKLTDPSKGRFGFGLRGGASGQRELIDIIEAFGSPIVVDGQPAMKRDLAIEAVTYMSDLYLKHKVCPPSSPVNGYRPMMDAFKGGQTAIIFTNTGSLTEVQAALRPDQFGTAVRPKGPAQHINRVFNVYNGIMDPRQADAGWAWLAFWADKEAAIAMFEETGYLPATISGLNDSRIVKESVFETAVAASAFGQVRPGFPGSPGWEENIVLPEFQKVLVGASTPAAAVDAMIAGLEAAFR